MAGSQPRRLAGAASMLGSVGGIHTTIEDGEEEVQDPMSGVGGSNSKMSHL